MNFLFMNIKNIYFKITRSLTDFEYDVLSHNFHINYLLIILINNKQVINVLFALIR